MDATKLSGQLRHWAAEFADVTGDPIDVPDRLWKFLASRLAEQGIAEEDPDVVTVRTFDGSRKVRIVGVGPGGMLSYEPVDGTRGMGLVPRSDVHQDDLGKLTDILERLLRDGKVKAHG